MTGVLVVIEHDRGELAPASLEAITAARPLAARFDVEVTALTIGSDADHLVAELGSYGVTRVHQAHDDLLADFGPETWGEVVAQAARTLHSPIVLATGTDRGNEVLANAAATLDLPFAANCTELRPGTEREILDLTRVRWGGSLLERATMNAEIQLVTIAHRHVDPTVADPPAEAIASPLPVSIDPALARSIVAERIEREAGVTLATAPVVVGGGRGVGSAEGFAPLEELASVLGGVVGCSRAVTNNGWRNHTDQVGQTGTRIAPDVYLACGISGAIQHWVGAMASKNIIAINTDREANMVAKAGYAVIGDLHEVVPAITAEIERRR